MEGLGFIVRFGEGVQMNPNGMDFIYDSKKTQNESYRSDIHCNMKLKEFEIPTPITNQAEWNSKFNKIFFSPGHKVDTAFLSQRHACEIR